MVFEQQGERRGYFFGGVIEGSTFLEGLEKEALFRGVGKVLF